jgi:Gram-negative porin
LSAATTTVNNATNKVQSAAQDKPRVWSLAGIYNNGPIAASLAYEKHVKFYAAPSFAGDETAWLAGFSYNIAGRFNVGGMYTQQKWETGPGLEGKVKAWQIGVDANISGPHSILAAYTRASDVSGTAVVAAAGGLRPGAGADTGAVMAQIRYKYAFSKRTSTGIGYNQVKNDRNAGYNINGIGGNGGQGGGNGLGGKHSTIALFVDHSF